MRFSGLIATACLSVTGFSCTGTIETHPAEPGPDPVPVEGTNPGLPEADAAGDEASPGPAPAEFPRVDAVGSVCALLAGDWRCEGRYWRVDADSSNAHPPLILGPAGALPRGIARLGAACYVLASDATVWRVDDDAVQHIQLAPESESSRVALGIHTDGQRVWVLSSLEVQPWAIDVWSTAGGAWERVTTSLAEDTMLGPTGISEGELFIAGRWAHPSGAKVAFATLKEGIWAVHPLMTDDGNIRGLYDIALSGGRAHVVGDIWDGIGAYWRGSAESDSSFVKLTEPQLGTIATAVSVDGDDVYIAGVSSDGPDFVVTTPLYWRVREGGAGARTTVKLGKPAGIEAWSSAIQARRGTVVIAGTDGRRPVVWIDKGGDGSDVREVPLDGPTEDATPSLWGIATTW